MGGRGDNALNPKLAESSKGGLEGRGGERVCRGETGLGDDPMSTRRDIDVREGKGGEGGGHLVAEEGVGRVRGEGEKKPNRFGEHGKGGCREVQKAEAASSTREEGDMLTGVENGREGGLLLEAACGGSQADDCTLHWDKVASRVGGQEAHLVNRL